MKHYFFSVRVVFGNPHTRIMCLSIMASSLSSVLRSFFPGPLGFFCQATIISILLVYWLIALSLVIVAGLSKQWMDFALRAVSLAASLSLAFVTLGSGDYLHLLIAYPYYRSVINNTAGRPIRFYWGDDALIIPDGFQLRTLVYDDSGKTEKELNKELDTERRKDGFSSETTRLLGNFFMEHARYADD